MSKPPAILRATKHAFSTTFIRYPSRISVVATLRCISTAPAGKQLSGAWFNSSSPQGLPANLGGELRKSQDERKVKLGTTLRILQERLPTLLQSPLPSEILSPHISLHLFPSTHPHLPAVSGRVAYIAALWSSPIAWGRFPIVGNVKLEILSERMVKNPSQSPTSQSEQLVVRWRTLGKTRTTGAREQIEKITEFLGGKGEDEFTGLFIFEFDEEGRIIKHTIEHVQEGGNWEKGVGAKVVGLTDWLLGGMKGRGETGTPCPACCGENETGRRK